MRMRPPRGGGGGRKGSPPLQSLPPLIYSVTLTTLHFCLLANAREKEMRLYTATRKQGLRRRQRGGGGGGERAKRDLYPPPPYAYYIVLQLSDMEERRRRLSTFPPVSECEMLM